MRTGNEPTDADHSDTDHSDTDHGDTATVDMSHSGRARRWLYGVIVAAALVGGVIAVTDAGDGDDTDEATYAETVSVDGAALPAYDPQLPADPASGATLPKIVATAADGTDVVIDPADGRPKLLLVVAHWCDACAVEMDIYANHLAVLGYDPAASRFDVHLIATLDDPDRPGHPNRQWAQRYGWPASVPVIVDDGAVFDALGVTDLPAWVFVHPEGIVAGRHTGHLPTGTFDTTAGQLAATIPAVVERADR